jgi:hypothetical protein
MAILYVNAYAVTRHWGGREEGGWWYNAGAPLASVPIAAETVACPGGSDGCNCGYEVNGIYCADDRHLKPEDSAELRRMRAHLRKMFADVKEGDIYSVNGGVDLDVWVEERPAHHWPEGRPRYE